MLDIMQAKPGTPEAIGEGCLCRRLEWTGYPWTPPDEAVYANHAWFLTDGCPIHDEPEGLPFG